MYKISLELKKLKKYCCQKLWLSTKLSNGVGSPSSTAQHVSRSKYAREVLEMNEQKCSSRCMKTSDVDYANCLAYHDEEDQGRSD